MKPYWRYVDAVQGTQFFACEAKITILGVSNVRNVLTLVKTNHIQGTNIYADFATIAFVNIDLFDGHKPYLLLSIFVKGVSVTGLLTLKLLVLQWEMFRLVTISHC